MAFFRVRFQKTDAVEVVVECKDREELERAVEGTLDDGLDDWAVDEGEWEECWSSPCGPNFDPDKEQDLQGIDRTDPDRWKIVCRCDDTPEPPETEEDRRLREFREAEDAGQMALTL